MHPRMLNDSPGGGPPWTEAGAARAAAPTPTTMERNSNDMHTHPDDPMEPSPLRMVWSAERAMEHDVVWQPDERFNLEEVSAMMNLLQHLTHRWPGFAQRWLLRRATRLPHLHGTFSSCAGSVAFAGRDGSTGCCIPWTAE